MIKLPRGGPTLFRGWLKLPVLSSVRARIIGGFGLLVVILLVVGAGSALQVQKHRSTTTAVNSRAEITFLLLDAQAKAESAAGALQRYVIVGDEIRIAGNDEELLPQIRSNVAIAVDDLTRVIALEREQGDQDEIAKLNEIFIEAAALVQGAGEVIAIRQSGDVRAATEAFEQTVPSFREFERRLNEAAENEREEASILQSEANTAGGVALWLLIISSGAGAVLGLVVSGLIARSIIKPLSSLEATAVAVSEGDLMTRAQVSGPREFTKLGISLNRMTDSLLDASKRRELEDALKESEALHRNLVETSQDLIFRCDAEGRFTFLNHAWEKTHGHRVEAMLGKPFTDFMTPEVAQRDTEEFRRLMAGGSVTGFETTHISKSGDAIHLVFNAIPLLDGAGGIVGTQGTAHDITARKRAEETIKHQANHDALTDLPNRNLFHDRLSIALAQARRKERTLAVMFLDLDKFKVVNDAVGHGEGDQLLRNVGERLAGLVRECDTVARLGGDEFAILSPEIGDAEAAAQIAERILEGLRKPFERDGQEFYITASIGIALFPDDGEDVETLLTKADMAMYRAKEGKKNSYQIFTEAINDAIKAHVVLERELHHGLEHEEFVLHYQPLVDIDSGQIVGTEALVRWRHPDGKLIPPGEFLAVAEDSGLIVPLGEWVLRTACAQAKAWQDEGHSSMRVAVNVSARELQQRNIVNTVARVLEETGLDPHLLQLEITEDTAMDDVDYAATVLRKMSEMGVQLAMDDFGTGYSSLSFLKRFPIDVVKIDRSFVRDLAIDPSDAAISTAIITMAHTLNVKVIAEGVETEEQLNFLKDHQCDEFQGFLFSKAVPAEKLDKMLAPNKRRSRPRAFVDSS